MEVTYGRERWRWRVGGIYQTRKEGEPVNEGIRGAGRNYFLRIQGWRAEEERQMQAKQQKTFTCTLLRNKGWGCRDKSQEDKKEEGRRSKVEFLGRGREAEMQGKYSCINARHSAVYMRIEIVQSKSYFPFYFILFFFFLLRTRTSFSLSFPSPYRPDGFWIPERERTCHAFLWKINSLHSWSKDVQFRLHEDKWARERTRPLSSSRLSLFLV